MPVIYCSSYTPGSSSIAEVTRLEHLLGRELLRHGISRCTGKDLSPAELSASLGTSENGKPFLPDFPDIHFNITHCDGLAACAFDSSPVGVDAEKPGYFAEILIKKALTEEEQQFMKSQSVSPDLRSEWFFRFWTLKEAFVKQSGIGVDTDLHSFSFSFTPADGKEIPSVHVLSGTDDSPVEYDSSYQIVCREHPEIKCFQAKLPSGHILSACFS